jgi:CubicO group peptidase (beta-lactamase class C family)
MRPLLLLPLFVFVGAASLLPPAAHTLLLSPREDPTCTPVYPPTTLTLDQLTSKLAPAWSSAVAMAAAFLKEDTGGASSTALSFTLGGHTLFNATLGTLGNATSSKPTVDTIYRLGSITKIFPAMLTVAADEAGRLPNGLGTTLGALDTRFRITDWFGHADSLGPSLDSVLYQQGGLPREAPFPYTANRTTAEALAEIDKDLWMIAPPWQLPSYSNLGFALLGHLVSEQAFGANFSDVLASKFAGPLKLPTLGMTYPPAIRARMPVPYATPGVPGELLLFGWAGPAGNARISLRDADALQRAIQRALVDGDETTGLPLSAGGMRRLFGVQRANNPGQTGLGSPWEMLRVGDDWIHAKGGNTAYFSAGTSYARDLAGAASNVFWNGAVDELAFLQKFWAIMIPAVRDALAAAPSYPAPPTPRPYVGTFALPAGSGISIVFAASGGGALTASLNGVTLSLSYMGQHRFRIHIPLPMVGSCFTWELNGVDLAYAVFQVSGGNATSVRINPFSPGVPIPRVPPSTQ